MFMPDCPAILHQVRQQTDARAMRQKLRAFRLLPQMAKVENRDADQKTLDDLGAGRGRHPAIRNAVGTRNTHPRLAQAVVVLGQTAWQYRLGATLSRPAQHHRRLGAFQISPERFS